jgi:hypothetical protein
LDNIGNEAYKSIPPAAILASDVTANVCLLCNALHKRHYAKF